MTVPSETSNVSYTGNGVTVDFPVTFPYFDDDHLVVKVTPDGGVETTKTNGVDYNVSPTSGDSGTVTFVSAPALRASVVIERTVPITQDTAFRSQGSFSPTVHEDRFDKDVMIAQQLDRRITTLEGASTTNNAVAGDGLSVSGSTWSVGSGDGVIVSADAVAVDFGDGADLGGVSRSAPVGGVMNQAARIDHKHDISTAAAGTAAIGDSAAEGSAASLARSDHKHAFPAPAAPANVTKSAADAGAATTFARADHKHDISTAAPSSIGTANSEGSATTLARSDHVHDHGVQTDGTLHAVATAVTAGFMSSADKSTFDAMGAAYVGNVQTTDATATTCASRDVAANSIEMHEAMVVGYRSTRAEGAGYKIIATFRRDGGTVTRIGSITVVATHEDAGNTAWDATFTISGTTVRVTVTGEAAKTVNWRARVRVCEATSP